MSGLRRGPLGTVWYLLRRAVVMEWRGYQAIWRLLARRPRVPQGARAFTHHKQVLPLLLIFVSVSAVEVVVVDILVHRWPAVRIPLLVLGIWGLVWMLGLLCGMLTRPHSVGPDGIRARYGAEIDIPLAWETIDSVALRTRSRKEKEPDITEDEDGRTFHLWVAEGTNLEIIFDHPVTIKLPRGRETVTALTLHADEPRLFLDEVRRQINGADDLARTA